MKPARPAARLSVALVLACAAHAAGAHALQERYELPLPLPWVAAGGCIAVLLSFVGAAWLARPVADAAVPRQRRPLHLPTSALGLLRVVSVLLFAVTVAAALWGTQDPLMNLAPTMVWVVAWLGVTFICAFLADVWPALDPWRGLHAGVLALAGSRRSRLELGVLRWPDALGCWPAVALLLGWSWLEVVYPIATSPRRLGALLLAWTALSVAGMLAFGRRTWQSRGDVFALTFATFGRISGRQLDVADPQPAREPHGLVAFVMALLATVIFDGLHGAPAWHGFEAALQKLSPLPLDVNGHAAGTAGLLLVWLAIVLLFEAAMWVSQPRDGRARLALALLPIAAGYAVAHNLSTFVLQGQRVFALLSDPFGRQWDLFGTAAFYPDVTVLDARATWFIAVGAIVAGHAASVWLSHRVALAQGGSPRRVALRLLPLTALALALTATSLLLLASGEH
ncbi:hypothetical protein [Ramlibacter sp.]|uniref:hypothetical protein n=1 Tax=Ramlibacter sp. TaxID=1917967 RepID=UPI00260421A9|nr:hypothetical protein [Ramlibacter sp.]MDB5954673.1 fenitrothion hydrolase protein FedB [Ramlibacter sp.]